MSSPLPYLPQYEHRIRLICSAEAQPFQLLEHVLTQKQYQELLRCNESDKKIYRRGGESGHGAPCGIMPQVAGALLADSILEVLQRRVMRSTARTCGWSMTSWALPRTAPSAASQRCRAMSISRQGGTGGESDGRVAASPTLSAPPTCRRMQSSTPPSCFRPSRRSRSRRR